MWPVDEDGFIRIGPLHFLLHDDGWFIAWRQIVKAEGRWPHYGTFRRRKQ